MNLVWATALGLCFYAGPTAPRFAGFAGRGGDIPDPPAHMDIINHQQAGEWWFVSGTFAAPYVSLLELDAHDCALVVVRFRSEDDPPTFTVPCWHPADADFNGVIDSRDISAFVGQWLTPPPVPGQVEPGDWNLDGPVNSADIAGFLGAWLEGVQ
jgi:hypothetical protein